ncbi:hypothetical protein SASPL_124360 [Salvia splendens]|uniref:diacylglycerol kinase (ATP) n=1 Tax=Salvia splendens TaxID=180675 RepID=A0A8X8XQT3_SALSN|nr:hypothetical protein SASPL_124360 [Salvia splendens]
MASGHLDRDEFIKEFHITSSLLEQDTEIQCSPSKPEHPVLVFINSKSGGQLGGELLVTYRSILNKKQVIDLGEEAPDSVLRKLFINLERLKNRGDGNASEIEKNLRLIVAGGDGTAGWILGVVSDLKLSHPPPIATMPLGTGNNLPFAFGWGKKNPGTDRGSVLSFMDKVRKANKMKMDSWHIMMRMKAIQGCAPVAPPELPHSLHSFHPVSQQMISMWKVPIRIVEGSGTTSAWVRELKNAFPLQYLSSFVRSIVCLSLPSFSGGLNPWGTPNSHKRRKELTPPFVDDGLLEIVGFRNAWHGLVLLTPNGHGTRLAQAHRVKFEFHKARSAHAPPPPDVHDVDEKDSDKEDEEVRKKFGAADTFKIPEGLDISYFS